MSDIIDQNFRDLISLFTRHGAEFLVVGAHSLAAHDVPRSTGDIDLWVAQHPKTPLGSGGLCWSSVLRWEILKSLILPRHVLAYTSASRQGVSMC
ncbi:MAG: hypothetical protein AAF797_07475 [Planctomycetota bacterium]